MSHSSYVYMVFFFNDTATTESYTLSLHDALPISEVGRIGPGRLRRTGVQPGQPPPVHDHAQGQLRDRHQGPGTVRSEEHTSELQSRQYLVCRLLLEKKKTHS